ncbi:protealysin inhibitor emfourin [Mesorhizobium sp.]|uniref:protealysin inhibitor emfourin n=1 Tax=Mesorhizobium sp. TaxID=1871066 RepID=UPI00121D1E2F|nr:protealysin inhibitor emfourin [Mesorhizobium sp.]TIS58184.1 MAG: hypothetical protein E5W91_09445 [Mesorhizobium sp.]TIS87167.1 MAG: hypothetical protein E5W89_25605 [Mesorhizobium sp.]
MAERFIIERQGGLAGLKGRGTVDAAALDEKDREALQELFERKKPLPRDAGADRYIFTITRQSEAGSKTLEVPETLLPRSVARAVKDQI